MSLVLTENPLNLTMQFHKPELMEMHHWFSKEHSKSTKEKTRGTETHLPPKAKTNSAPRSHEGTSKETGVALPFAL